MSTKIYNAYKYNGNISDLAGIFIDIKEKYISDGYFKEKLLRYYHPYDRIDLKISDTYTIKYLKDIDSIWDFVTFLDDGDDDSYGKQLKNDITMSVVTLFDKIDNENSDIYCIFNNIPTELIDNKLFVDYHYQNSTDMSNYNETVEPWALMSEDRQVELDTEWEKRELVWNRIFKNSWSPSDIGLSYDVTPLSEFSTKRKLFKIFKEELNNPILIRRIKIKRLRTATHIKNTNKITENGGGITEVTDYCIKNNIKLRDINWFN